TTLATRLLLDATKVASDPPVGAACLYLLAQPPLEADAVAVAHDEHPEAELGVDRGPANIAVEGLQLLAKVSRHPRHNRIDPAQEMARRNAPFEVEQVALC